MFPSMSALLVFTAGLCRSRDHSCLVRDPSRRAPIALLWIVALVAGCGSFHPTPMRAVSLHQRAVSQDKGKVRVTVAVPTTGESARLFGVPLAAIGIQPVWLKIENHDPRPTGFCPSASTRIISRPGRCLHAPLPILASGQPGDGCPL